MSHTSKWQNLDINLGSMVSEHSKILYLTSLNDLYMTLSWRYSELEKKKPYND